MEERQTREKTMVLQKREGETPLECLNRFREEQPLYKEAVLSYAGRLDPMAKGMLLVLVDEENKRRQEYLGLDKEYEVEILFGVGTDTGDILGVVQHSQRAPLDTLWVCPKVPFGYVAKLLLSFIGSFSQKYPLYSSKSVNGKPLFQWAREDKIDEIEIPEKEVHIYDIQLLETRSLKGREVLEQVKERIAKVKGDFRQEEIIKSWENNLDPRLRGNDKKEEVFSIAKIRVKCSSGTYMRLLAERIGEKLQSPALAWNITRTAILSPSKDFIK